MTFRTGRTLFPIEEEIQRAHEQRAHQAELVNIKAALPCLDIGQVRCRHAEIPGQTIRGDPELLPQSLHLRADAGIDVVAREGYWGATERKTGLRK